MAYLLAPGISCCVAGDRFVFLDLGRDRYFCLPHVAEVAFRALVSGGTAEGLDHEALRALVIDGAIQLAPGPQRQISHDLDLEAASASLVDHPVRAVPLSLLARALTDCCLATVRLKVRPLAAVVEELRKRKASNVAPVRAPSRSFEEIGAAFASCGRFLSSHDRCLPRSMALMMSLLRYGHAPTMVFAVAMRPFAAHCWVQMGAFVLDDHLDNVRKFTPILAV